MNRSGERLLTLAKLLIFAGLWGAVLGAYLLTLPHSLEVAIGASLGTGIILLMLGGAITWFARKL